MNADIRDLTYPSYTECNLMNGARFEKRYAFGSFRYSAQVKNLMENIQENPLNFRNKCTEYKSENSLC